MTKTYIKAKADEIWTLLYAHRAISIQHLANRIQATDRTTYLCLGWLARENKVLFYEEDETVYVERGDRIPELFY